MAIVPVDLGIGDQSGRLFSMISSLGESFQQGYDRSRERAKEEQQLAALAEQAKAYAPQPAAAPQAITGLADMPPAYNAAGKAPTFVGLTGGKPSAGLTVDKEAFVRSMMPHALEASKATGVDPRIIVAQAALESGWGASAPGNNFFGIKSHGAPGGQTLATMEVVDGQPVRTADSFRTFGSLGDSVKGYADFINANPRYAALKGAQGLEGQAAALQASGYATDPQYGSKVLSIAKGLPDPGTTGATAAAPAGAAAPTAGGVQMPAHITRLLQSSNPYAQAAGVKLAQAFETKVAELQMQLQLKRAEKLQEPETLGVTPIYGTDANGNPAALQLGNRGSARAVQLPEGFSIARDPIKVEGPTGTALLDPQTRQQVGFIPKDVAGAARAKEVGEAAGKAEVAAPGQIQAADNALDILNQIQNHPNRERATGIGARFPTIDPRTVDFEKLVQQAKGGAFLTAIQQMRGLGALSEKEGEAATSAVARLSLGQSDAGFLKALDDYRNIVVQGKARAQAILAARGGPAASGASAALPSGRTSTGVPWSVKR